MKVTPEQALAFVEALTGFEEVNDDGDDSGAPKSPHAQTHLAAVFGRYATTNDVWQTQTTRNGNIVHTESADRVAALASYLQAVAETLIDGLRKNDKTGKYSSPRIAA